MIRKFLPKQQKFIADASSQVIFSGAYGAGKSLSVCAKVLLLLTRYPRNRGFLSRKTLQSLKTTTLKTLLTGDGDVPPVLPSNLIKFHNKQERLIVLRNDSELYYGPMDIEFVKSMNLGFAAVDEVTEYTEEEWNALNSRLRLASIPVRQIFGATNPSNEQHWIYARAVTNPLLDKNGKKLLSFHQSSTLENTFLPPEYIENLQRTLFGHYYKRYVMGEWCGSDKLVYDNYNQSKVVIPNFVIPKHWNKFRAFDFGYRSPFVCLWFVECGDDAHEYGRKPGDIILYRELYYTQRTTNVNAQRVNQFSIDSQGGPEKYKFSVSDHDCGDRADLEANGIYTLNANKDIGFGIQKVRERLGNEDPTRGNVIPPKFFIFENTIVEHDPKIRVNIETGDKNNDPTCLKEEIMAYSWKPRKEEPEDRYNHACDALRYFFATYDGKTSLWKDISFMKV